MLTKPFTFARFLFCSIFARVYSRVRSGLSRSMDVMGDQSQGQLAQPMKKAGFFFR
jgi:hypothetical protein